MEHDAAIPPPRVHTRQQAAAVLQVPVAQVDAAIRRGDLAAIRVGRLVRIPDAALRRFAGETDALTEHIRRLVDGAPPLDAEQRDRLAVLLRPATAERVAG